MHEGIGIWTLGVLLALSAIYAGVRTQQRKKGSPKKASDNVAVVAMAVMIVLAIVVLVVKA